MQRKENCTKKTLKKNLEKINRILNMAVEDGIISKNPAQGIRIKVAPREMDSFNTNQANKLLEYAKKSNHRHYYLWAFALFTGMRKGELYVLQWSDVDLVTGLISINKQFTDKDGVHPTKSYRNRIVPISAELKKVIFELKSKKQVNSEKLYTADTVFLKEKRTLVKKDINMNDLVLPRFKDLRHGEHSRHLKAFCIASEIKPITFHSLRATFITNLLSHGVSLANVMSIVGHEDIETTNGYLRRSGIDIKHGTTDLLGYKVYDHNSQGSSQEKGI